MHKPLSLPDWRSIMSMDDADISLFATALLIARDEYPDLDPTVYDGMIHQHVQQLRPRVAAIDHEPMRMLAINQYLFDDLGYAGNHDAYYDPRNSYVNDVCERRLGIPISLALIQIEVARRLDIALEGVSFPGHFLVRLPVDDGVLVMDPFNRGRPLDVDELRERAGNHVNGDHVDDNALHQVLHPATNRAILVRMLRNLHGIYAERNDWQRAVRSADRVLSLSPDHPDALRDRGAGYLELGHKLGARRDLGRYLQLAPEAPDAAKVRELLIDASTQSGRLN